MGAAYRESKLDNNRYCKSNGQFTRHLRLNNLTYQEYFEKYITKTSPKCQCGKPLTFYQKTESYANSCGIPKCVGKTISIVRQNTPIEAKQKQAENYRQAQFNKTTEQKKKQKEKAAATYFKNFGTTTSNSPVQKKKSAQTKLQKYGDEKYNNSQKSADKNRNKSIEEQDAINESRRKTNIEKYGVSCVFLLPNNTRKSNKGNASIKDYVMPSGVRVGVRGYEPTVISILLNQRHIDDIVIQDAYSDCKIGPFTYSMINRHTANYYPDIYIPSENKIIEVKSRWWWDGNGKEKYKSRLLNNLRKRKAVLDKGYIYEVWLFEDKKNYKVLIDDSDF